jgi:hypothetical protein
MALPIAEVGCFIHILPKTIERQHVVEMIEHKGPPWLSVMREPIGVDCFIWPDFTIEELTIELHKDILSKTVIIS